jgi:hypothetical protein
MLSRHRRAFATVVIAAAIPFMLPIAGSAASHQ